MDQNLNVGDGGIDNGQPSSILDPAYRYELYKNYKDIRKSDPDFSPNDFCKNKKINGTELSNLIREFDENPITRIE